MTFGTEFVRVSRVSGKRNVWKSSREERDLWRSIVDIRRRGEIHPLPSTSTCLSKSY